MRLWIIALAASGVAAKAWAGLSWQDLPAALDAAPESIAMQQQGQAAQQRQVDPLRSLAPRWQAFANGRLETGDPGALQAWPEAGLRAHVNLWKGGRDSGRSRWLQADASAAQALANAGRAHLLAQARQAWLEAWQARQRMKALQDAMLRCQDDQARTKRQAQSGLIPSSDALALQVLYAELDQHVFDEGHLADEAEHHLAALLGWEPQRAEGLAEDQVLAWPSVEPSAEKGAGSWQEAALNAEVEALEAQTRALGGNWQPSFDLESQARLGRSGYSLGDARDLQALASLSLAWSPASNLDKEQAWLKGLKLARQSSLDARRKAEQVENEELGHALSSWIGRRQAAEDRLLATAAFRKAVLEENSRGVRDSRDLSESNQALLEADLDIIVAQARAWKVWSELQALRKGP